MALSNPLCVNNHLLAFIFFLVFLCYLKEAHVYGARGENKPYHVVPVKSLEPNPNCTKSTNGPTIGSQKLEVRYRYGSCSPKGHVKKVPSSAEIFWHDKIRVQSINGKTTDLYPTKDSKVALPAHGSPGSSMYVVTVGFGTPKRDYTLIFDTGSDRTWMQCKPCPKCYKQDEQIFDPSQSSTYHNGSCKANYGNTNTEKQAYNQGYRDGSYSNGFLGCDTLTLEPSDVITNFQFGCGQDNSEGFGTAAGILGLGRGEQSLVSQTSSKFGKSFSYCLPTPQSSTPGYLLFGEKARSSSSSLQFTPLLPNPQNQPSLYFVKLVGITVGTTRLKVSPSVFSSPGTVVDSGTVITRLPKPAYLALKSAFQESMSKYPFAPAVEMLDTCYDLSQYKDVIYPTISFNFGGGADVSLDPSGIISVHDSSFCLAFAAQESTDEFTIIGNTQQQALQVFYDLKGGRIGFGTKRCHN